MATCMPSINNSNLKLHGKSSMSDFENQASSYQEGWNRKEII